MTEQKDEYKQIRKSVKTIRNEFLKTLITMIISAFALVAALAWNTAISEIIKKYLGPGNTVFSWIVYALIVTLIAALVGFYLSNLIGKIKEEEEREEMKKEQQEKEEEEQEKTRQHERKISKLIKEK